MKSTAKKQSYYSGTKSKKFLVIVLLFFFVSLLGWALETLGFYFSTGEWFERGFLSLPFCTLYGFSAAAIYLVMRTPISGVWKKLAQKPKNKFLRALLWLACFIMYAVAASLFATAIEFVTGLFYDKALNIKLWDYSGFNGNLSGYITLEYSVYWGLLATLGMVIVWHPLMLLFGKLSTKALLIINILLTTALLADFIFNIIYLVTTGQHYKILPGVFYSYKPTLMQSCNQANKVWLLESVVNL